MSAVSDDPALPATLDKRLPAGFRRAPPSADELDLLVRLNTDFRQVLFTRYGELGTSYQNVAQHFTAIQEEVHEHNLQYFKPLTGDILVRLDGTAEQRVPVGEVVWVPAGTRHGVRTASGRPESMLVAYHPWHHPPDRVDHTLADAEAR